MSVREYNLFYLSMVLFLATVAAAEPVRDIVSLGNELYNQGEFEKAVEKYDSAIKLDDKSSEAIFDKAAGLYRLGDFSGSAELYNDAAIKAGSAELVIKSRYNLGNCYFQQGRQAVQKNPQKAIKNLKQAIVYWRKVLGIDAANEKAAGNMQIAKAIIQQLKEQKQDPNQSQDPNSQQNKNQSKDPNSPQDKNQSQDPNSQQKQNQSQDPNSQQSQNSRQNSDPNQANENKQPQEQQQKQQPPQQNMTAQQILEKEQQQKKRRQMFIRSRSRKVDKDW